MNQNDIKNKDGLDKFAKQLKWGKKKKKENFKST